MKNVGARSALFILKEGDEYTGDREPKLALTALRKRLEEVISWYRDGRYKNLQIDLRAVRKFDGIYLLFQGQKAFGVYLVGEVKPKELGIVLRDLYKVMHFNLVMRRSESHLLEDFWGKGFMDVISHYKRDQRVRFAR